MNPNWLNSMARGGVLVLMAPFLLAGCLSTLEPAGFMPEPSWILISGAEEPGDESSLYASLNAGGDRVVFMTRSSNLGTGSNLNCTNSRIEFSCSQILLSDAKRKGFTLVSSAVSGEPANGPSKESIISADGKWVAYASFANNIDSADIDTYRDVYLYNVEAGSNRWISRPLPSSEGGLHDACPGLCGAVSISGDGRFVVFDSDRTDLVVGDQNDWQDVFLYDASSHIVERISTDSFGRELNHPSWNPNSYSVSDDGRFVVFMSAPEGVAEGPVATHDVYLKDRYTGDLVLVSKTLTGQPSGGSGLPAISGDGRFVAFSSSSPSLVVGDTNEQTDVFVYNVESEVIERISVADDGSQGNGGSWFPSISRDGRFVAFGSTAGNLDDGDENGLVDAYLYDRETGGTSLISRALGGLAGDGLSTAARVSADGSQIVLSSRASNFVPGVSGEKSQIYVRSVANILGTGVT